jgi:hypothetical protein
MDEHEWLIDVGGRWARIGGEDSAEIAEVVTVVACRAFFWEVPFNDTSLIGQ